MVLHNLFWWLRCRPHLFIHASPAWIFVGGLIDARNETPSIEFGDNNDITEANWPQLLKEFLPQLS